MTRALAAARRYWLDALVVLVGLVAVVENAIVPDAPNDVTSPDLDRGPDAVIVATLALIVAGVLLRRRYPFGGPALGLAATLAASFAAPRYVPSSAALFVLLTISAALIGTGPDQRLAIAGAAGIVGMVAVGVPTTPPAGGRTSSS